MAWSYCCCSEGELWGIGADSIYKWDLSFDQPFSDLANKNTTSPREWWLKPAAPDGSDYAVEWRFGATMDDRYIYILTWARGGTDDPGSPYEEHDDEIEIADYVIRVVDKNTSEHIRRIPLKRGGAHYSQQTSRRAAYNPGGAALGPTPNDPSYYRWPSGLYNGTGRLMMSKYRISICGEFDPFVGSGGSLPARYMPVWDTEGNFLYEVNGSKFTSTFVHDHPAFADNPHLNYIYNPIYDQRMDAAGNIYIFSPSQTPDEKIYQRAH